jgi:hypothetical protein
MVPGGPSEYTVEGDSKKPVNQLTIVAILLRFRFIIRDKRVGDGVRTQKGTGDARLKTRPKIYILINCSSQRALDSKEGSQTGVRLSYGIMHSIQDPEPLENGWWQQVRSYSCQ